MSLLAARTDRTRSYPALWGLAYCSAAVIDLHCHVLAGIDDGPRALEDSVALARMAAERGASALVATPHVSFRYRNDAGTIAAALAQLRERLQAEGVELELHPGAEIAATRVLDMDLEDVRALGLGGGRWLLLEPAFATTAVGLETAILRLRRAGHNIVLAHPERCPAFHRDPALLESLVGEQVLTSVTAGSLVGRFGKTVRRFALELADAGMVHNVASDTHDRERRPPGVAEELQQAGLAPLAEWLTETVPAAILSDREAIPPTPPSNVRTSKRMRGLPGWKPRLGFRRAS
jgi:protein-tyrosine phosphatase